MGRPTTGKLPFHRLKRPLGRLQTAFMATMRRGYRTSTSSTISWRAFAERGRGGLYTEVELAWDPILPASPHADSQNPTGMEPTGVADLLSKIFLHERSCCSCNISASSRAESQSVVRSPSSLAGRTCSVWRTLLAARYRTRGRLPLCISVSREVRTRVPSDIRRQWRSISQIEPTYGIPRILGIRRP